MRILFVWTNKDQIGYKPLNLSLLIPIMRQHGHEVALFDTTFIDFGFTDNSENGRRVRIFMPVDYKKYGYDMNKKKTTIETELQKKLEEFCPDIVALSVLSDEINIGYEVSRVAKQWCRDVIVLWGGKAATISPHKILCDENIDYLCIGEGIEFLPEFVAHIEMGTALDRIQNIAYSEGCGIHEMRLRPYFQHLDSLPFLDWSLFDERHFLKPFDGKVMRGGDCMISWGCPHSCTYCINESTRQRYGKDAGAYLRRYSVDRTIKELKYLRDTWNIDLIIFHDEDFTLKPKGYFEELAQKYHQQVNVPFAAMVNAKHIDEQTVELLKEMNCLSASMGIETGNERLRKTILKRTETKEDIIRAFKLLNDAGIRTSSFNMLGIPGETRATLMETIDLNRKAQPKYPNSVFFYPYEGTELGDYSRKNGLFDEGAVYEQDKSALTLPTISKNELIAVRERFVLYVKMPEKFHTFIERSEMNDRTGKRLTEELYHIYEMCVFENNGVWNDNGKSSDYLKILGDICET